MLMPLSVLYALDYDMPTQKPANKGYWRRQRRARHALAQRVQHKTCNMQRTTHKFVLRTTCNVHAASRAARARHATSAGDCRRAAGTAGGAAWHSTVACAGCMPLLHVVPCKPLRDQTLRAPAQTPPQSLRPVKRLPRPCKALQPPPNPYAMWPHTHTPPHRPSRRTSL